MVFGSKKKEGGLKRGRGDKAKQEKMKKQSTFEKFKERQAKKRED